MTQQTDYQAQLELIERENSAVFALKWIGVGSAIALCLMAAGCDSFLPKETPRYNTVAGERRAPVLNAEMLAASAASAATPQMPAPVPMVQETPMPARMPAPAPAPMVMNTPAPTPTMQPRQPMPQPAPQPIAQPIAQPATQPVATAPAPQSPSMLDQMTGIFTSSDEPPSAAMQRPYPTLPPTTTTPQPQTIAPDLDSEIAALERDLMSAQIQQAQATAPVQMPEPQPAPSLQMQPIPEEVVAPDMMAAAETAAMPTPQPSNNFMLPPPPRLPNANNAAQAVAPQPMPEQTIPMFEPAASPEPMPAASTAPQPALIPMAPEVYANTSPTLTPSGLIPPDLDAQFDESYLPPARYTGRRLKRY